MDLHIPLDPVSDIRKCPKKGGWYFLPFFYTFSLIKSIKTFSKVMGVSMNVGPYMAYILYI